MATNPCCKHPIKNPPSPFSNIIDIRQSTNLAYAEVPLTALALIGTFPVLGFAVSLGLSLAFALDYLRARRYYNDFPDVDNLKSNTAQFPASDIDFLKKIYDAGEGAGFDIDKSDVEEALQKHGVPSAETRCYLCRKPPQFKVYTSTEGLRKGELLTFLDPDYVFQYDKPFDGKGFQTVGLEHVTEDISFFDYVFLMNDDGRETFLDIMNCEEFGLPRAGGANLADEKGLYALSTKGKCIIEDETSFEKTSKAYKNLCDIILAETIKSYLL